MCVHAFTNKMYIRLFSRSGTWCALVVGWSGSLSLCTWLDASLELSCTASCLTGSTYLQSYAHVEVFYA